jgi:dihydrofolate reductase
MTFLSDVYQRADAFLFGRRSYEILAGYWGAMEDPGHPIAGALNTQPKYLASTTLTEPRWANTTVLSGDVAAAIGELKAKPARCTAAAPLSGGCSRTTSSTSSTLLTYPVVVGQGARLFPDAGPDKLRMILGPRPQPGA